MTVCYLGNITDQTNVLNVSFVLNYTRHCPTLHTWGQKHIEVQDRVEESNGKMHHATER